MAFFLRPPLRWVFGVLLFVLLLSSCGGTTDPEEPPISGIVRTADNGKILEEDSLDWQPRQVDQSGLSFAFSPAFPNPATSITSLQYVLAEQARVRIWAVNGGGRTVVELRGNDTFEPGIFRIDWDLKDDAGNDVPAGLYRVYFEIVHGRDSKKVHSFGDVEVKR